MILTADPLTVAVAQFTCPSCHQAPGSSCRSTTNKMTKPHQRRKDMAAGYLSRRVEVIALEDQIIALKAQLAGRH